MPITPNRFLQVQYATQTVVATWNEDDLTGDPFIGYPYQWEVTLTVTAQAISSHATTTPFFFDGVDVAVGDWIVGAGTALSAVKIISISFQDSSSVTCVIEDVERYNTFSDPTQNGSGNIADGSAYVFQVFEGNPLLGPFTSGYLDAFTMTDIISRFQHRNYSRSYLSVLQVGHGFVVGDQIVLQTAGTYVGAQATGLTVDRVIGTVTSISAPGLDYFTFKPIGEMVDIVLPGNLGDFSYVSPSTPGLLTATAPSDWSKPAYIKFSTSQGVKLDRSHRIGDVFSDISNPTNGQTLFTFATARIIDVFSVNGLDDTNFTFVAPTLTFDPIGAGYDLETTDVVKVLYRN